MAILSLQQSADFSCVNTTKQRNQPDKRKTNALRKYEGSVEILQLRLKNMLIIMVIKSYPIQRKFCLFNDIDAEEFVKNSQLVSLFCVVNKNM